MPYTCIIGYTSDTTIVQCVKEFHKSQLTKVCVIGDSHTAPFSHCIDFQYPVIIHNIGAVTAYGLKNPNSRTNGRNLIFYIVKKCLFSDIIIFVLGEIDCRSVIPFRSGKNNISLKQSIIDSTQNYKFFINEIIKLGYKKIIIYGVVPPTQKNCTDEFLLEKIGIIMEFNNIMKSFSSEKNIEFIDIYSNVVNKYTGLVKDSFIQDEIHINSNAGEIIRDEIRKIISKRKW